MINEYSADTNIKEMLNWENYYKIIKNNDKNKFNNSIISNYYFQKYKVISLYYCLFNFCSLLVTHILVLLLVLYYC